MKHLLVEHHVRDFDQWKRVYDMHAPTREAGMTRPHVFCSADDPNDVFVMADVEDEDKAQAFMHSPEIAKAMKDGGVEGEPSIMFLEDAA